MTVLRLALGPVGQLLPVLGARGRFPVQGAYPGVARPEGSEHAPPTLVIEGVAELVEALRAA